MDIDLLNFDSDDHMDVMMMMDKLSDLSEPHNDVAEMPTMVFTGGSSSSAVASPTLMNIKGLTDYTRLPVQDLQTVRYKPPVQEPPPSRAGRWPNAGELLGTNAFPEQCQKQNSMEAMREMIFALAAMQPIYIDPESVKPPKRKNVKISKDPLSVAARHRRERISERIRILQRLVPGGTKMDTASMLDEAIHYMKYLKNQVQSLERAAANRPTSIGFPMAMSNGSYLPMVKPYQSIQNVQHYADA